MNSIILGKGVYRFWSLAQRVLAVCCMMVGLLIVGFLTWSATDRTIPVNIKTIRVLPPLVRPGEEVNVEFTVVRNRACAARGEEYIFDGEKVRWAYPPTDARVSSDDLDIEDSYAIKRKIPENAAAGTAKYRVSLYYHCPLNPIHLLWPITDVSDSLTFEIIAPSKPVTPPATPDPKP